MSKQWFDERLYEMKQDRDRLAAENAELKAENEKYLNTMAGWLDMSKEEVRAALTKVKEGK